MTKTTTILAFSVVLALVVGIASSLTIADAAKPGSEPSPDIVKRQFIQTIVSENGRIQINSLGGAILYYGDTLCEIQSLHQGTGVVIHFAMETTVQHLTDCVNNADGQLFQLENSIDATFQAGDLLAVELNTDSPAKIVEVYREQTP
jgi:hypothetical protein